MTQDAPQLSSAPAPRRRRLRAPQDLVAGASLIALALCALWAAGDLTIGRLGAPGPGLVPRVITFLVGVVGVALVAVSFLRQGEVLERWSLRAPLFVCLGVVGFALTIRAPGLCIAGPLVVMVSGAASAETRFRELALFALALTAICVGLFRYLLHLPIPILVIRGLVTL